MYWIGRVAVCHSPKIPMLGGEEIQRTGFGGRSAIFGVSHSAVFPHPEAMIQSSSPTGERPKKKCPVACTFLALSCFVELKIWGRNRATVSGETVPSYQRDGEFYVPISS